MYYSIVLVSLFVCGSGYVSAFLYLETYYFIQQSAFIKKEMNLCMRLF